MLMERADIEVRVLVAQVDLKDSAGRRHELQLRECAGVRNAEAVAQHRRSWDEIWPSAGEDSPPRRWSRGREVLAEILAVRLCAREQSGQGFDLFGRGLPALQAFGGNGLGQGVAAGVGHHEENVEVDAR
ncbi:hypothetical protein BVU76_02910 [Mycolicibacterium porcinum]|nr:hypothetical protein BVU76_02910 [Mycolicibacterium porcinum]